MEVKVIRHKHRSVLIEWRDEEGVHRGYMPEEVVTGNTIDDKYLSLLVRYGLDWELLLRDRVGKVTNKSLAKNLQEAGIWTYEDLRANPTRAQSAIQKAYGVEFSTLMIVAEKHGGKNA